VVAVANKADIRGIEGCPAMSTLTGEGVEAALDLLLIYRKGTTQTNLREPPQPETQE